VRDLALVEAIIGNLFAIGRPPDGRGLVELLSIYPAPGAVFHSGFLTALCRDGRFASSAGVAQPEVAVPVKGAELAVRRRSGGYLPAARDSALAPPAESAAWRRRFLR